MQARLPEALEPLRAACDSLAAVGFESPSWHDLLHGEAPPVFGDDEPQLDNTRGWQRAASQAIFRRASPHSCWGQNCAPAHKLKDIIKELDATLAVVNASNFADLDALIITRKT